MKPLRTPTVSGETEAERALVRLGRGIGDRFQELGILVSDTVGCDVFGDLRVDGLLVGLVDLDDLFESLAFGADGARLAAAGSRRGVVRVWDVAGDGPAVVSPQGPEGAMDVAVSGPTSITTVLPRPMAKTSRSRSTSKFRQSRSPHFAQASRRRKRKPVLRS